MIVDALLGTGFAGAAGAVAEAIAAIELGGHRSSASTCRAAWTLPAESFAAPLFGLDGHLPRAKPGLWIRPGKAHAGEVETIDIGIPRGAPGERAIGLIDRACSTAAAQGRRLDKFSSGHVLVAGGSRGLTGRRGWPPRPHARGRRLRDGVRARILQERPRECGPPEMMTRGLADEDGALSAEGGRQRARGRARAAARLALGPGLGRDRRCVRVRAATRRRGRVPMVLDADGSERTCRAARRARQARAPSVLTPHAGRARPAARAGQLGDRARASASRPRGGRAGRGGRCAQGR